VQDQDQGRFFWSGTVVVLRPTVSDHIIAKTVVVVDYDDDDDDDDDAVSDTVYKATQCEGAMSPLMLSCPGSQRLLIRSAMFGRQDWNTTCPHDSATPTSDCASPRALDVVQTLCNG